MPPVLTRSGSGENPGTEAATGQRCEAENTHTYSLRHHQSPTTSSASTSEATAPVAAVLRLPPTVIPRASVNLKGDTVATGENVTCGMIQFDNSASSDGKYVGQLNLADGSSVQVRPSSFMRKLEV